MLRSTVGTRGVRDPALVRSPAGDRYWIIATDLCIACGTVLGERDQQRQPQPRRVGVHRPDHLVGAVAAQRRRRDPGRRNAWAPEAIWNPATDDYVLYWATNVPLNGVDQAPHLLRAHHRLPQLTTPQLYLDRPGARRSSTPRSSRCPAGVGGYRYVRASGDGQITIEGSNSILGTWTTLGNLSGIGLTGAQVEGPMWMKFNARNEWALYLDQYATGRGYLPVLPPTRAARAAYRLPASGSTPWAAPRSGTARSST